MAGLEAWLDQGRDDIRPGWRSNIDIYQRHFGPFIGTSCTYLELGQHRAGSLALMRRYLGPDAQVVGWDPELERIPDPHPHSAGGSEAAFPAGAPALTPALGGAVEALTHQLDSFHIVLDDGGCGVDRQLAAFRTLFPRLRPGGIYLVEALHTQAWPALRHELPGPCFYDFARDLADHLFRPNRAGVSRCVCQWGYQWGYQSGQGRCQPGCATGELAIRQIQGIHFYDGVVVVEKRSAPISRATMTMKLPLLWSGAPVPDEQDW